MVKQQNVSSYLAIENKVSVPFLTRRDSQFPSEAFVPIPIYTYIDFSVEDDLQGCQYSSVVSDERTP